MFDIRALRRISGPKRKEQEAGENCRVVSFIICTPHKLILVSKWGIQQALDRKETHTKFQSENLKELGYLEDLGMDGHIKLTCILKKQ